MKISALKYTVLSWVSGMTMAILLLVPFHAFLTVWTSSILGHYTALRLWKEVLLVFCILGVFYLLVFDQKIRTHTLPRRLVQIILAYTLVNLVWGLIALHQHDVSAKAFGYGLVVNLRFLAFFLVTWAVALRMSRLRIHWRWLVLWSAAGVIIFGLLQAIILPHDFLRHFGYGDKTIPVYETINHNPHYIRVASALRGANPLGAYLLIPISLLSVMMIREGRNWKKALFLAGAALTLFFTFSRSAWIGAVLSVLTVLLLSRLSAKTQKIALASVIAAVFVGASITAIYRNNVHFQNFVFHTQTNSSIKSSSNQGHLQALEDGAKDVEQDPLGDGPGTAGPASYYNDHRQVRISENYFVQVAQETGVVGLILFLLINVGVGYLLFLRRDDPLALSLFASLIGLTFINLLSHAWTDDTLAYVWWGLAGVAMAPNPKAEKDDHA
jgi:O-antigen ligase